MAIHRTCAAGKKDSIPTARTAPENFDTWRFSSNFLRAAGVLRWSVRELLTGGSGSASCAARLGCRRCCAVVAAHQVKVPARAKRARCPSNGCTELYGNAIPSEGGTENVIPPEDRRTASSSPSRWTPPHHRGPTGSARNRRVCGFTLCGTVGVLSPGWVRKRSRRTTTCAKNHARSNYRSRS